MFRYDLAEREAAERSGGDSRLIGSVIGNLPAFRVIVPGRKFFTEYCFQSTAAPKVALEDRIEAKWIKCCHAIEKANFVLSNA